MAKKYGFYSHEAVLADCGTSFCSTPEGKEVEVTCVSEDPEGKSYLWIDKVCLGEVVSHLRRGHIPMDDQQMDQDWDNWATGREFDADYYWENE